MDEAEQALLYRRVERQQDEIEDLKKRVMNLESQVERMPGCAEPLSLVDHLNVMIEWASCWADHSGNSVVDKEIAEARAAIRGGK